MTVHERLTECPICGSQNLEHLLGEHRSSLRGTAHNVPQTVCRSCGEVFLDAESLKVIRQSEQQQADGREHPTMNMLYWKTSHYWIGKLFEHPEIMTQGDTLDQLKQNLKDAYWLMVMEDVPEKYEMTEIAI